MAVNKEKASPIWARPFVLKLSLNLPAVVRPALGLEAVRAVDRLVAARYERHLRLFTTRGACGRIHLAGAAAATATAVATAATVAAAATIAAAATTATACSFTRR